ncbi:MAG: DUF4524 domain-containing protein [Proteobacteria bacterium]|nr:DUF4524 domain-containing protein [Pseudomonadota bacterium]
MKTAARAGLMLFLIMIVLFSGTAYAAVPLAKVTIFTGEAVVLSGADTTRVSMVGQELNEGDRVQTKQGMVQVTFNDGAILKLSPFTSALIQEREEESGILIFKTKKAVRRVTCFIGKMWFKSGASKMANYLQTPTAVMGIRGSDADFGFDNLNTYLNMYSGEAAVVGKVMRGFFENPGIDAATKSAVYRSLEKAYVNNEQAKTSGKELDLATAQVDILDVAKTAVEELKKNPDEAVKQDVKLASVAVDASMASAVTNVSVVELKESLKEVEKAAEKAKAEGKTEDAKKAQETAQKTVAALVDAEKKNKELKKVANDVKNAVNAGDLGKAQTLNTQAQKIAQEVKKDIEVIQKVIIQIVPTTVPSTVATTVATTVAATTTETTAAATVPSTTTTTTTTTSTTTKATTTIEITTSPAT